MNSNGLLLQGGSVFDVSTGTTGEADVLVGADGLIAAVGKDLTPRPEGDKCQVLQVDGKTILPGLINMHDHFPHRFTWGPALPQMRDLAPPFLVMRGVRAAMMSLMQGVTTVRWAGDRDNLDLAFRDAIAAKLIPGPRVIACGTPITTTGGHAWFIFKNERDGAADMRVAVRERIKGGAEWIKILTTHEPVPETFDGQHCRAEFTQEEFNTVTETARDWGRPVMAHASGSVGIGRAVAAGVDTIEHGIYLDRELAARMADKGIGLVPTLSGYFQTASAGSGREPAIREATAILVEPHRRAIEAALAEGVAIAVGTDTAGFFFDELELLVKYGADNAEALQAATIRGAEMLRMEDRIGSVEQGKIADLVVVDGDPLVDLRRIEAVELVIQGGIAMRPDEIRVSAEQETESWNSFGLAGGTGVGVPGK